MALIIPVLVRGINNLSDARYCAGMGADGLIFTLDPSLPGAVDVATVKELAGWVAGVELIGEFGATMPVSEINRLVEECGLQRVALRQLPASPLSVPVLLHVPLYSLLDNRLTEDVLAQYATLFPAGFGLTTTLEASLPADLLPTLASLSQRAMLWLRGAITPDSVRTLLEQVQPAGLVLEGGDEIKTGLRDFTELEAVFEALEEE
ncbi:beta/alpha barrel domain-containing protein [Hymenobacter crusticola]|uniref:Phosphoribosylanthranilate isomerase n=1 Tax=Hymenobacter crusticola TaxID=1770526 RepID=A0A243WG39_9BACT|nr:hypothetical protein [Hymenobacter crusticola]OUJ74721.1 hypothetical protein BXP70_08130 [Hymenobacter crusticola]